MQNVTARYQSPDGELTAAQNISLTVSQGEFVSIVGPSGCGKSTLLTIMAGLKPPSEGQVLLDGEPARRPGRQNRIRAAEGQSAGMAHDL